MPLVTRSGFINILTGKAGATAGSAGTDNNAGGNKFLKPGLDPKTGVLTEAELIHLIRRSLFGCTLADIDFFKGKKLQQCLDVILTQATEPPPPVNTYNSATLNDPDVPFGKTWVNAPFLNPDSASDDGFRFSNLKGWWLGVMIDQDRSLTERMTLFWSNHLAAQMMMMKDSRLCYQYLALLRAHALGNFKKLVREVTLNPGMLVYLNGNQNTAAAPNENYARELQELFTVGKGPGSHYTEDDVKQAARVLTGWDVESKPRNVAVYHHDKHDTGDKQFSAFYNNKVIKGKDGAAEIDELIDMIFEQRETARFCCRNLYRWFVYYKTDDETEKEIIEPLADILIKNNFEIAPVLRALLGSNYFFAPQNMGCQIKNPVDHMVGACRQLHMKLPGNKIEEVQNRQLMLEGLSPWLIEGGMEPGDPPNVAGWPAYYQAPAFNELWINATTLTKRNEITDYLVQNNFDVLAFAAGLNKPADVNSLIAESCKILCPVPLATAEIKVMKNILLSNQQNDHYWTDAWNDYFLTEKSALNRDILTKRLQQFYSYLLQRSEYQLN